MRELELLAQMESQGSISIKALPPGAERDLIAFLAYNGYVTEYDIPWQHPNTLISNGLPGESQLERLLHQHKVEVLSKALGHQSLSLRITHAGRLRMAELRQGLRSGRIREKFGILWDGRHFERDLKIQLLAASDASHVALVYMDLNGMKKVNDTVGHSAGDVVLRAYFDAVASSLGNLGEAYGLGGDEVGVILPNTPAADAEKFVSQASRLLMTERLRHGDRDIPDVSVAAGAAAANQPSHSARHLRESADGAMYRAKEFTKGRQPRPSSLALDGDDQVRLFTTDDTNG